MSAELSQQMLTCAACSQVVQANDEGFLPLHEVSIVPSADGPLLAACPGSYTLGHPHRPLPEIKPLEIEMLPDDDDARALGRDVAAVIECMKFLDLWLINGMRTDDIELSKIVAHTTRARQGSLNMISLRQKNVA